MSSEFDTNLPSVRKVQSTIKDQKQVEMKLTTGDVLAGQLIWQDPSCMCLRDQNNQQILIWRGAIAYIKPKG
ncbi:MAG TPA: RNA-binding protein hfq [Cyanobacteria bacterium UBA11369]|nr:RNA-binding protein hfq [Cyanobacteria bacterium UBA11371]HBE36589.1 RNA-binding protein hfq [Cyanobacteria bacterium UBA11368]HBE48437.1 RNA-binding protein hfq [Cyanobacteria bacterium UBA11369]